VQFYLAKIDSIADFTPKSNVADFLILIFVLGYIVKAAALFKAQGSKLFFAYSWNVYILINLFLYVLFYLTLLVGNILPRDKPNLERYELENFNFVLVAEMFYSLSTLMTFGQVLRIFQLHRVWGPMQLTLMKTGKDIFYFLIVFFIFVFCAAFGIQQLYEHYTDEWIITKGKKKRKYVI
jgi:hypothetical protein